MKEKIFEEIKESLIYALIAVAIGVVVGVIEAIFGIGLSYVTQLRNWNIYVFIPLLAPAGLLIVWMFGKFGGDIAKGMGMLFGVWNGDDDKVPVKTVPFMIGSTWITHLFGGSAGREGVAVQVGAAVANKAGRLLNRENSGRILMVAGIAAGFAGLFRTPFAAIAFALELLVVGELRYEAIIPTIVAAFAADYTSGFFGIEKEAFDIGAAFEINFPTIAKVFLLGLLFGIVGGLFAYLLKRISRGFAKAIKNPYIRIASIGVFLSIIMIVTKGRYSGSGANLISECFETGTVLPADWILKMTLTIVTLAAGYKGGEVAPLFAIGTTFGMFIGDIIGFPAALAAALGYITVFGSGTGTLLAPIFIGGEIFGWQYTPLFIISALAARCINQWVSIYPGQKKRELM